MKVEREAPPNDGVQLPGGDALWERAHLRHAASFERRLQTDAGVHGHWKTGYSRADFRRGA